jgi:hypothetical protein
VTFTDPEGPVVNLAAQLAGGNPTGPAGGDLGGDYPDPTVEQAAGDFSVNGTLTVEAPGAISNGGDLQEDTIVRLNGLPGTSGIDSSSAFGLTPIDVTSGVAFNPQGNVDVTVYLEVTTTSVGMLTVTIGPTGDEHTIIAKTTLIAYYASSTVFTVRVPAGWLVVATWTGTSTCIATCVFP